MYQSIVITRRCRALHKSKKTNIMMSIIDALKNQSKPKKIVEAIINDLTGRRGLSQEWDMIDEDIQSEIRQEWENIVSENLK